MTQNKFTFLKGINKDEYLANLVQRAFFCFVLLVPASYVKVLLYLTIKIMLDSYFSGEPVIVDIESYISSVGSINEKDMVSHLTSHLLSLKYL